MAFSPFIPTQQKKGYDNKELLDLLKTQKAVEGYDPSWENYLNFGYNSQTKVLSDNKTITNIDLDTMGKIKSFLGLTSATSQTATTMPVVPTADIKTFDSKDLDTIRQTTSRKTLGTKQFLIPLQEGI